MLNKKDVAELLELSDWLAMQPLRCATSGEIAIALPHLRNWTTSTWQHKRDLARVIYYRSGYGWQLHRTYKSRLTHLTEEINLRAIRLA